MHTKAQIQARFHKAKPTYTQNATIQQEMQYTLLQMLSKHCPKRNLANVLELGSGNGILCQKLLQIFDFESFLAVDLVDFSREFAEIGQKTKSKIKFLQADFEDFNALQSVQPTLKYDLILSNAAIQWVHQPSFLPKLNALLSPNGFLAFSTFGKENYKELRELSSVGLEYLNLEDYAKILGVNFEILESFADKKQLRFSNALEVFRHLQSTGVNSLKHDFSLHKTHLKAYQERFCNVLTYHCLYVVAKNRYQCDS